MANKLAQLAGITKTSPSAMPTMDTRDMKYEAREALHTITKAEEHRKDKDLMRAVKQLVKAHVKAVC